MATAIFTAFKTVNFIGNPINFNASASYPTSAITSYVWDFDDGGSPIVTSASSTVHSYENYGIRYPSLVVYEGTSASAPYLLPDGVSILPHPVIALSGIPKVNSTLALYDANGPYYVPDTIAIEYIDFGDGSPIESGNESDIYYHSYSAEGTYTVSLSAIGSGGNASVDTVELKMIIGTLSFSADDYIAICGPVGAKRIGPSKTINLTNFLPEYLQETDIFDLTEFFEKFLNDMYAGESGYLYNETVSAEDANVSTITYTAPDNISADTPTYSILEKIKRLTELHDIDLIDADYIQFFAKYLGYNVDINRNEIGGFGSFDIGSTVCSASDSERYLRFVVSELPHWYKIKTTRDMVRVILYSFGLIGDIMQYYTKPISQGGYDENFVFWKPDLDDKLTGIPADWFPTPHYSIKVDLDANFEQSQDTANILNLLMTQGDKMIRAIESIRPINTVFHNLGLLTTEYGDISMGAETRFLRYLRIDPDGPADWWAGEDDIIQDTANNTVETWQDDPDSGEDIIQDTP